MRVTRRSTAVAVAALTLVVAACGTGGATTAPTTTVPAASATAGPTVAATDTPAPTDPATASPAPTLDPFAFVAPYEGTYSGTWINETFGSTGTVSVEVDIDRATGSIQLELTLGGNVFGNPEAEPETITATIGTGSLGFTSKTFGETALTLDLEAGAPVLTLSSPNVPSDRIRTFTATTTIVDPTRFEFEYEVTFRDGIPPATGRATLTR
jgi:hypothetical protein